MEGLGHRYIILLVTFWGCCQARREDPRGRPIFDSVALNDTIDRITKFTNSHIYRDPQGNLRPRTGYGNRARVPPSLSRTPDTPSPGHRLPINGSLADGISPYQPKDEPPPNSRTETPKVTGSHDNHDDKKHNHNHGSVSPGTAHDDVEHDHGRGFNSPDRAVFVYNGTSGDDVTSDRTNTNISFPTSAKGLCLDCLCNRKTRIVACYHTHRGELHEHSLDLNRGLIPPWARELAFVGYETVRVEGDTFSAPDSNLKDIFFQKIKNLHLKKDSFFFSPDATKDIHVLLTIDNCSIGNIEPETFTQHINKSHEHRHYHDRRERKRHLSIEITDTTIGAIQTNAFWRATLDTLNFTNTKIGNISSKAMDIDVTELCKFINCQLPSLVPDAICLHSKTTYFRFNQIEKMSKRSIAIETEGMVLFEYNRIAVLQSEALLGITPVRDSFAANILFTGNHLGEAEPDSLAIDPNFPPRQLTLSNNTVDTPCACNISTTFESLLGSSSPMRESLDIIIGSSHCRDSNRKNRFISIDSFLKDYCAPFPVVTVTAIGVAILLLIVAVTVGVVCSLRVQQLREEATIIGDCISQSFSTLNKPYLDDSTVPRSPCYDAQLSPPAFAVLPWGLTVPEVKTYQQNQTPDVFTEQTESICGSSRNTMFGVPNAVPNRASCPFN